MREPTRYPRAVGDPVPDLRPWPTRAWPSVVQRAKEVAAVATALGVLGVSVGGMGAAVLRWMHVARTEDIARIDTSVVGVKTQLGEMATVVKAIRAAQVATPVAVSAAAAKPVRKHKARGNE